MSDIKDILGISRDASAAPRPRPSKQIMKKPVGMSREVFALLNQDVKEGNAPLTLAPSAGQAARLCWWRHSRAQILSATKLSPLSVRKSAAALSCDTATPSSRAQHVATVHKAKRARTQDKTDDNEELA